MGGNYSVHIGTAGGTHYAFWAAPVFTARDLDRYHRTDVNPAVLGAVTREISLTCWVDGRDPPDTVTNLGTLLTGFVNARVVPGFFEVRDEDGTAVTSIGQITSASSAWEEVQITGFNLPAGVGQLVAGAEFTLTIQGRKTYGDSNDVWYREQSREVTYNEAGLERRTLTTELRITKASSNTIAGLASSYGAAESRAVGWRRVAPSNNSAGYAIRYTKYPLLHEAVITSIVEELGSGYVLPTGAGDGSVVKIVQRDQASRTDRHVIQAEISGTTDPLGWAESQGEGGEFVGSYHDRHRNFARATFAWNEPINAGGGSSAGGGVGGGTSTRTEARMVLTAGGEPVRPLVMSGGALPVIRRGGLLPWTLTETIQVWAESPSALTDIPIPALLEDPWVLGAGGVWSLPYLDTQPSTWTTTVTRSYVWDGDESPLEDTTFLALVMERGAL